MPSEICLRGGGKYVIAIALSFEFKLVTKNKERTNGNKVKQNAFMIFMNVILHKRFTVLISLPLKKLQTIGSKLDDQSECFVLKDGKMLKSELNHT